MAELPGTVGNSVSVLLGLPLPAAQQGPWGGCGARRGFANLGQTRTLLSSRLFPEKGLETG